MTEGATDARLRLEPSLSQSATTNEHREQLLRLRRCFGFGIILWPLYTPLDFLAAEGGASLPALLTVRVAVQLALILFWLTLRLKPPPMGVVIIEILAFSSASGGLAMHAILGGGFQAATFTSSYLVLVIQGLILPSQWKWGLLRTVAPVMIPPLGLLVSWLVNPGLIDQLQDRTLLTEFFSYIGSYFAAWIVVLYAGNTTWELRRQIHENKLIGRYKLIERVGKGGMGEVWRAWHPTLKTEVALKLTNKTGEHELSRFQREIDALTAITHPGVVKIFDCGVTEEGLIFYTMELLHGVTLRQRLDDEVRPMTTDEAIAVVADVADALHAAHGHGIVHRDIKPENILLVPRSDGGHQAKLIDFGIAKNHAMQELESTTLTATGAILGTPLYLAPEQALGQHIDARTDVYALGAVLFACLTGRPPFMETTLTAMLLAHAQKQPPPPSLLVSGIDASLDAVVLRCLEKKPDDRYASAKAMRDALLAVAGHSSGVVGRPGLLSSETPTVDG